MAKISEKPVLFFEVNQLRHRERSKTSPANLEKNSVLQSKGLANDDGCDDSNNEQHPDLQSSPILKEFFDMICVLFGLVIMLTSAYFVMWYLAMLHENLLWFSTIGNLEREISFRTEQGLYYSYYKQLVNSPDFLQGINDLKMDNVTEHGHSINILQRFNVHQEVFLAAVYRILNLQRSVEPIIFYTRFVFILQAVLSVGIFCNAWLMSRSWLAGLLSIFWFVTHKNDSTRVNYSVPLRESFSLPFIFCQMAAVSLYLKSRHTGCLEFISLLGIAILTFLYTVTWQFSQFVTLTQVVALYVLASFNQVSKHKALKLNLMHAICIAMVCVLQGGNVMLLSSLSTSLIPVASVSLSIQGHHFRGRILTNLGYGFMNIAVTFASFLLINWLIKTLVSDGSDQHIFKFVMGKLGFVDLRDFESRLYLCNEAFAFIDYETYKRLCGGFLLPIFSITLIIWTVHVVSRTLAQWQVKKILLSENDEFYPLFAFHAAQSTLFAFMAMTTMRMKCLWIPHACIVAASGVTHPLIWTKLEKSIASKGYIYGRGIALALILYLTYLLVPFVYERMEDLNEFWDPDTVELMVFIKENTPKSAAFAGSMQLLAGVKLCTGRPITNHPHFEDYALRKRTLQIYQMYAKRPPEIVYDILKSVDASYILLEDSICLTPTEDHCHLVDILDLSNGHVPHFRDQQIRGLIETQTGRFCDEIRHGGQPFSTFFKAVFVNRTFRVYKVL